MAHGNRISEEFTRIMRAEAASLTAKFEQIRTEYDHSGLKGDEAEQIVRTFLKGFLPQSYGFANGQILDQQGTRSKEVDIAICNQYHPFSYGEDGRGVLFIEGVDAVVEAKSILNESQLESAIYNCRSVRDLEAQISEGTQMMGGVSGEVNRIEVTPYAIFAFECPYTLETLDRKRKELIEELDLSKYQVPDLIFALDTGLIVMNQDMDGLKLYDESGSEICGYSINQIDPDLFMFLMFLQDKMPSILWMPPLFREYLYAD